MPIDYNLLEVLIDLSSIVDNLKLVAGGRQAWPVVKADAYGHGIERVAAALSGAGYGTLCAGTVGESARLRAGGFSGRIVSLLGPVQGRDFDLVAETGAVPFVYEPAQIKALSREGLKRGKPMPVCLKFDTGMSRLGFRPDRVGELADILKDCPGVHVAAAASHLPAADMPSQREFTLEQAARFKGALKALAKAGFAPREASLANSAASMAYPDLAFDALRPGIAMYGGNPFHGTELARLGQGLKPAMQVRTRIVTVKDLRAGDTVSYGRTYQAPRAMRAAVVAAGYADGYSRGLSGKARVLIDGQRAPVLGRVCMQLIIVDVTDIPRAAPAGKVWLLGGPGDNPIRPEELADWWGTITYEVFCLLGLNRRVYLIEQRL